MDTVKKAQLSALTTQVGGTHYSSMAIQPIEYVMANKIGFAEGNVIKYVSRWRNKGGIADLKKAAHMLSVLIENTENEEAEEKKAHPLHKVEFTGNLPGPHHCVPK